MISVHTQFNQELQNKRKEENKRKKITGEEIDGKTK